MKSFYSAFVALLLLFQVSQAQDSSAVKKSNTFRTWSVGLNGGLTSPYTVVTLQADFPKFNTTYGYGIFIKKQVGHSLGFQADVMRAKLSGDNGKSNSVLFSSYETNITWAASLSANITVGNISWLYKKSVLLPYANVGGGLLSFRNTVTTNGVKNSKYDKQSNQRFLIPVALGTKIAVNNSMNIDLGYKIYFVDTDVLDGLKAKPMNDKFSYAYLGLEFPIGKKALPQMAVHNPINATDHLMMQYDSLKIALEKEKQDRINEKAEMSNEQKKFLIDTDEDGISDYFDKCPNTPKSTKIDGSGCPLVIPEVKNVVTEADEIVAKSAQSNLQFDFGKASIRPDSFPSLNKLAEMLMNKKFSLRLEGHTDNVGSEISNLKLSSNRAEAVKNYLIMQGVKQEDIETIGYGELMPIQSNKTENGRQKNRRVAFIIK